MGLVYLIKMKNYNFYKIGHTTRSIETRLDELRTGNPEPLELIKSYKTNNYIKLENWLHRQYKINKKEGEWFEFDYEFENKFIHECERLNKLINLLLENNPFYN